MHIRFAEWKANIKRSIARRNKVNEIVDLSIIFKVEREK